MHSPLLLSYLSQFIALLPCHAPFIKLHISYIFIFFRTKLLLACMASSSAKAEKRLGEFLNEKQEPFILELYLLERGYSKRWTSKSKSKNGDSDSSSCNKTSLSSLCGNSNKKRKKNLLPFSKVLTALHNKLALHNRKCCAAETDRFSTASSSTVFYSCSDFDEDRTSSASHNDKQQQPSSQHATKNGKHCHTCLEQGQELNEDVSGIRKCGVLAPKKMKEDSLLSAALWSLLIHKTKQVLFDCIREEQALCEWGSQQVGDESKSKITNLLTLDYSKSMSEWSKFEQHVKAISVEIAEGILEGVKDEIVSDMIQIQIQISDFTIINTNRILLLP